MQINLSIRQLRAFIVLAREKNFTRAAALSHLSQPAFSALIRQLEGALGLRLFERSTRKVELTSEGAEFEPAARRVLNELETALAGVSARTALRRGRVSIALLPSLAADWLPDVLADFHAEHPGIEMQVADVLSEPCIERVRNGKADFALAATRADTSELRAEYFCSDDFHLVCRADHLLAKRRDPQPADLTPFPFVHLSRTSSVRQYVDAATHPNPLPATLEVDQLATVAGMVRAGIGISVVPALTLYQFRAPDLVNRPLRWPGLHRNIYLVRRHDRELSFAAKAFYDWVMARRPRFDAPKRRLAMRAPKR